MIAQIVAVSQNGVIGKNNRLPWQIPEDLQRFKALTMGKTVIMGRKTYLSLPKKLIGRRIIVVSSSLDDKDVEVCRDLNAALALVKNDREVFIAGGESLYRQTLPLADKIYLTLIEADFDGDSFYPLEELKHFQLVEEKKYHAEFVYRFLTFVPKPS